MGVEFSNDIGLAVRNWPKAEERKEDRQAHSVLPLNQ
jgi:hypothetical protein